MAQGEYKVDAPILVVYQAPNAGTGLVVNYDLYDNLYAIDVSAGVMTEIATSGRYRTFITPDAEGHWTMTIQISDGSGKVVKHFAVAGHDLDAVGDVVVALDTLAKAGGPGDLTAMKAILDTESGVKAAVVALNDISSADVAAALATYDGATSADLTAAFAALNDPSVAQIGTQVQTELATYDAPTKAELDAAELAIRGADSDTLETLSDQVDGIGSAAMVG